MDSVPSLFAVTRSYRPRIIAGCLALTVLVLALGQVAARGCPAQDQARLTVKPGLILMAGDVSNPACTGAHRLHLRSPG